MKEHKQTGILDVVASKISRVVMWMSVAIVAIILYEVIVRTIFGGSSVWAYDLSWWLAAVLYLLSGWYVMQQRAHIRLTLFYDLMPRWLRRVCDVMGLLVLWMFCFAVIWGGSKSAYTALIRWEGSGSPWDPPIPATVKPLLLITLLLISVQALSNLYFDWKKQGEDSLSESPESTADVASQSDSPPRS